MVGNPTHALIVATALAFNVSTTIVGMAEEVKTAESCKASLKVSVKSSTRRPQSDFPWESSSFD